MAVSAFQKVLNGLFQQFIRQWGREPQTPKEWMDLQNEAVRYFNKTKGAPTKPKGPPFQGWTPKVIPGGKKEGIESLLETGDVTIGTAPKTKLSTLEGKKQKLDTAMSKEEWIAKKKQENKETVKRWNEKFGKKKTVEDYRDEGDFDPGGFAGGGIARPGYFLGSLVKLLRGGKNVYRGTSTGGGVGGHFVPESKKFLKGKYYTTDKKEAEMYAELGKGILGIKKLTLSKKEFEKAKRIGQKFHEEIILPKKLAKKAEIDIPGSIKVNIKKIIKDIREGNAEGGRIGMAGGGVIKKFIEQLFIKASNDIRQGKGKWKGLTQDQWIKQHDDLTKMHTQWRLNNYKRLPPGAEQYIGMNDLQVARAVKQAEKEVIGTKKVSTAAERKAYRESDEVKKARDLEDWMTGGKGVDQHEADEIFKQNKGLTDEQMMQKAYDEIKGGSGFTDDYKYDADVLADEYAKQKGAVYTDLPQDQISIYYDPALKRVQQDLLKRREARKALKDVEQKIELQMFDPKDRKPNAEGGRIGYAGGTPSSNIIEIVSYIESLPFNKKLQALEMLPDDIRLEVQERLGLAQGGRANFIFGGSAGLRALIKRMRGKHKRINVGKVGVDKYDALKKLMPREFEEIEKLQVSQLENLLESLKLDKQQMAMRASHKELNDPGVNFLIKGLEDSPIGRGLTSEADLAKYTDIDQDILALEQMIKNKIMKGRKPHESGGLAYMLGEPTYMKMADGGDITDPEDFLRVVPPPLKGDWIEKEPSDFDPHLEDLRDLLKREEDEAELKNLPYNYDEDDLNWWEYPYNDDPFERRIIGEQWVAGGGKVGHGPWTTGQAPEGPQSRPEMPQPQVGGGAGQPNPLKAPRLPSVAPRNMDPQVMQQQMMQRMMGQQGFPQGIPRVGMMYGGDPGFAFEYGGSWADWHDQHRNVMPIEDYIQTKLPKERLPFRAPMAGGGMTRRAFMKLMAGLASLPFIGKGVQKAAPKAIKEVTETITRNSDGIPDYAYD